MDIPVRHEILGLLLIMIALVCLSVTASFWFMSEACKGEIMKPRRRPLRCLDSFQNIFGREALRLITRPERSHLVRLAERIRERREETWRVLNRDRVAAFVELVTLVWVDEENCIRHASERGTADESLTGNYCIVCCRLLYDIVMIFQHWQSGQDRCL